MPNAIDILRGELGVTDCNCVCVPTQCSTCEALARMEALLQAADQVLANQILVKYDNAADPMWALAAAVRRVKGADGA